MFYLWFLTMFERKVLGGRGSGKSWLVKKRYLCVYRDAPMSDIIATQDSWETQPMPEQRVTVPLGIYLTEKQMARIRPGHIPEDMGYHWFMYCTEDRIRYFRSWTGYFIFEAAIERTPEGYMVTSVTINQAPDQVRISADEGEAQFRSLLRRAGGADCDV